MLQQTNCKWFFLTAHIIFHQCVIKWVHFQNKLNKSHKSCLPAKGETNKSSFIMLTMAVQKSIMQYDNYIAKPNLSKVTSSSRELWIHTQSGNLPLSRWVQNLTANVVELEYGTISPTKLTWVHQVTHSLFLIAVCSSFQGCWRLLSRACYKLWQSKLVLLEKIRLDFQA